ncbi:MAG: phosphoribosylanthranilate isomerase [Akkermansiaceae bacterium]|jgi:phosphoribosylanthranilate isomerase
MSDCQTNPDVTTCNGFFAAISVFPLAFTPVRASVAQDMTPGCASLIESFFSPDRCSLKICGITTAADAQGLVDEKVAALGVNFWPLSKRYIDPDDAAAWLLAVSGSILRVGVFVNAETDFIAELYGRGLIDVAQLHGDECPSEMQLLLDRGIPCIKALGIHDANDLLSLKEYSNAQALLLDTAAPGVYGGTGSAFDWSLAIDAQMRMPSMPILLAGGISPENAGSAIDRVHPAAVDIASGAEISPGIKDMRKVRELQAIVTQKK